MKIKNLLIVAVILTALVAVSPVESRTCDGDLHIIPAEHPVQMHNEPHALRVFHTVRENHVQSDKVIKVKSVEE